MKMTIIYDLKEGSECTRVVYISDFVTPSVSRTLSKSMNRPPQASFLKYERQELSVENANIRLPKKIFQSAFSRPIPPHSTPI